MNLKSGSAWLGLGVAVGVLGGWLLFGQQKAAEAGNDRFEDYVMSTGPVNVGVVSYEELDGVSLNRDSSPGSATAAGAATGPAHGCRGRGREFDLGAARVCREAGSRHRSTVG